MRERLILQTQLRELQRSISSDKRTMSDGLVGRVDVTRIRQHGTHAMQVERRAQQLAVRLLAVERQIEQARQRLADAMRQRRAIELLRDKRFAAWKREHDRREAAELDEMAIQGYARRASA